MASRTADGIHLEVADPSRLWAKGDCTRFKKPVRLGLRQSSRAPQLPASLCHCIEARIALIVRSCFLLRCNEVGLLSRRIIIRLHDDVKKKVQKNLRAHACRSSSCAPPREDIADTIARRRPHASTHDLFDDANTRHDTRECTLSNTAGQSPRVTRVGIAKTARHGARSRATNLAPTGNPHEQRLSGRRSKTAASVFRCRLGRHAIRHHAIATVAPLPVPTRNARDDSLAAMTRAMVPRIDARDDARQ